MKRYLSILAILLTVLLAVPTLSPPSGSWLASGQEQEKQKEVTVWVNTASGVYHCPGTRWYGKTKGGKYMGEREALKAGYRPAYGRRCGSACNEGASERDTASRSCRPQVGLLPCALQLGGTHGR